MSSNEVKDPTTLVTQTSEVIGSGTNSLMCSTDDLPLWTLLDPEFGVPGDVIFVIEDIEGVVSGEVWAHRNILALRSPVFKEMFYPKVEQETILVMKTESQMVKSASVKIFKKMLDHIYGKEIDWSDCSVLDVFQVMILAVKYKLNGLQTKVINCLRQFSLSNLDVLEAAVTAQELESIFPLASEALLANCCSIVQDSFPTSEDFLDYVTQLSITNSEMSLVALKLWRRDSNEKKDIEKKVKTANDHGDDSVKEKRENVMNLQSKISVTKNSCDAKLCLNCQKGTSRGISHCLDGNLVSDLNLIGVGCTVIAAGPSWNSKDFPNRKGEMATVTGTDSYRMHIIVRWNVAHNGEKDSNYYLTPGGAGQNKPCFMVKCKNEKCSNCKLPKRYCLHGKNVLYIKANSAQIGCKVISFGPYWGKEKIGKLATVVEGINPDPDKLDPENAKVKVKWNQVESEDTSDGEGGPIVVSEKTYMLKASVKHALGEAVFQFHCN